MLTGLSGSLPRKGCSRLSPFLAPWPAVRVVVSFGRVCGGLRLLRERRSLRDRQPLERFFQRIILGSERSSLWIRVGNF
jgi:hypothetical protein